MALATEQENRVPAEVPLGDSCIIEITTALSSVDIYW